MRPPPLRLGSEIAFALQIVAALLVLAGFMLVMRA